MLKLTCVTATFNAIAAGNRERLIRCVKSVANVNTPHEHLIYDGASTDGTVELLQELEKTTPGLKVVSEKDTGIYNALNKGVRDARGEWFYVLGCDDYICDQEVLDNILYSDELSAETHLIVAPVERDDGSRYQFHELKDLRYILWTYAYCHQGVITKTQTVRFFGGFDESYKICADGDLCLKVHEQALGVKYTYRAFANFSIGGMSERCETQKRKEIHRFIGKRLNLTKAEMANYVENRFVPLRKIFNFVFHRDMAFRIGARYLLYMWIRYYFRAPLMPVVILTRPFRCRHMN